MLIWIRFNDLYGSSFQKNIVYLIQIIKDSATKLSSLKTFHTDSSMFSCDSKAEHEKEQQKQQHETNLSIEHDQMPRITNKKQQKGTISFPFGKW